MLPVVLWVVLLSHLSFILTCFPSWCFCFLFFSLPSFCVELLPLVSFFWVGVVAVPASSAKEFFLVCSFFWSFWFPHICFSAIFFNYSQPIEEGCERSTNQKRERSITQEGNISTTPNKTGEQRRTQRRRDENADEVTTAYLHHPREEKQKSVSSKRREQRLTTEGLGSGTEADRECSTTQRRRRRHHLIFIHHSNFVLGFSV